VRVLVTCEHGGNRIPAAYAALFRGHEPLLRSHRGHDPGALATARSLARGLHAPLIFATVSRLLVELNRSPGRQFRESPIMHDAPPALRDEVCRRYYVPYRQAVEAFVHGAIARGERVVHISSHSFTPSLDGMTERSADVGLLYDPARGGEHAFSVRWQQALARLAPDWVIRRNYPYRGRSDGVTRTLRALHADANYCGIELEVNQKHVGAGGAIPARRRAAIVAALRTALDRNQALARTCSLKNASVRDHASFAAASS
jgi:predicted N-formylglutamate amidohydrolase